MSDKKRSERDILRELAELGQCDVALVYRRVADQYEPAGFRYEVGTAYDSAFEHDTYAKGADERLAELNAEERER